jgi:hypothetical protein
MQAKTKLSIAFTTVLVLAIAFTHNLAKAKSAATSKGVTLIQMGCGNDPSAGPFYGPGAPLLLSGYRTCEGGGNYSYTQLPSGTLYNMRVQVVAYTFDPTPQKLKVSLYINGQTGTAMSCEVTTRTGACQDLTDTPPVKAGDLIWADISVPDSNTVLYSANIMLEENIVE